MEEEIVFLRARIRRENKLAAAATCDAAACAHMRMARVYEKRLESLAEYLVSLSRRDTACAGRAA